MATHRLHPWLRPLLVASGALLVLLVVGSGIYLRLNADDEEDLAEAENRQTWVLQEELTFPASAGVPPIATGAVLALEASSDGTLYVGDQQNHRILVFDSAGTFVRSIGRQGSGPGELQDLIGVKLDPAGNLWAVDNGNARFTVFAPAGEPVDTRPFNGFYSLPWRGTIDSSGRIHNLVLVFGEEGPHLMYVRSSEAAADTLPLPSYTPIQREITDASGRLRTINLPFDPRPHWVVDREGMLWFGTSDRYALHRISYGGDTVATIRRPDASVSLTVDERAGAAEQLRTVLGDETQIESSWFPERRPQFESLEVDDQGRLWVGVPEPDGRVGYDVFDRDGGFIARARLQESAAVPGSVIVRGRFVYGIIEDGFGVPRVVRYRVEGLERTS